MAKYLINPIGAFYDIKNHYIKYIKTAFATRYESLEDERENLLNQDKVLYREPWIEPLPSYINSGHHVSDLGKNQLPGMSDTAIDRFKKLISNGLISNPDITLYQHQEKMLRKAMEGKDCVITSGTGSGKTESFLLPLIADIVKESTTWGPAHYPGNFFWDNGNTLGTLVPNSSAPYIDPASMLQRPNDYYSNGRPAAVRGIIIYPMNALVEDQMTRLREALDSDKVQSIMDDPTNGFHGNRIFFGRYNGSTPGGGILNAKDVKSARKRVERLEKDMKRISENAEILKNWIAEDPGSRAEYTTFFQRHEGVGVSSEMRSRMDMQATPPDILITNYSMLAAILMRKSEDPIITKTREWLEGETDKLRPTRVFHIIIDELHLNRGTAGTEMAYLTRLLINRLGLSANDPRLRILCSSASLSTAENKIDESLKYLSDFFGRTFTEDNIIEGDQICAEKDTYPFLPTSPFEKLYDLYHVNPLGFEEEDQNTSYRAEEIAEEIKLYCGYNADVTGRGIVGLLEVLNSSELDLKNRLLNSFAFGERRQSRAIPFISHENDNNTLGRSLSSALFGVENPKAAEGLIIARGLFDIPLIHDEAKLHVMKTTLPRLRFHYFFRNMDGLWADVDNSMHGRPVGKLHAGPTIKNPDNGNMVLELLYCEDCGEVFYTGKKLVTGDISKQYQLISSSPNIEGLPESSSSVVVEQRKYNEYGVFWPNDEVSDASELMNSLRADDVLLRHPIAGTRQPGYDCEWVEMYLEKQTGQLRPQIPPTRNSDQYVRGFFYVVNNIPNDDEDQIQAIPSHCPCCHSERCITGDRGANAGGRKSPLRGFRPGFTQGTQIFAKELFEQLPTAKTPKLVSFSDSREDAATVSNGIERNHYIDLVREALFDFGKVENIDAIKAEIEANENLIDEERSKPLTSRDRRKIRELEDRDDMLLASLSKEKDMSSILKEDIAGSALYQKIKKLGVNPNGCDVKVQKVDGRPWYDIDETNINDRDKLSRQVSDQESDNIFKKVYGQLFSGNYYGIESSGMGYVSISKMMDDDHIDNTLRNYGFGNISNVRIKEIIDSTARILGEKHRHKQSDFDPRPSDAISGTSRMGRYLNKVCEKLETPVSRQVQKSFRECIYTIICTSHHQGLIIDPQYSKIVFSDNEDKAYICPRCGRVHMHHSADVCTFCGESLRDRNGQYKEKKVIDIWKNHYLLQGILDNRPPHKLHCEEMTGQTDDQFLRQREFRDIITDKDRGGDKDKTALIRKIKSIDILCVTTTLEVGVDIGSLQAVLLANMPPQRYNYQQRVGRGGRRGQAFSTILTLCRGRSHDLHYFNHPQQITGDEPPAPFLSMDRIEISKRMVAKEVLYWAFREIIDFSDDRSIHGEFGLVSDWNQSRKDALRQWINSNIGTTIKRVINCIDPAHFTELSQWIQNEIADEIDNRVKDNIVSSTYLAEYLAETGLLPMYGMPTNERYLHTHVPEEITYYERTSSSTISRSIEDAISAFAPGAKITKDKQVFTPIGFSESGLFIDGRLIKSDDTNSAKSPEARVFAENRILVTCSNHPSCPHFETLRHGANYVSQDGNTCPTCGIGTLKEIIIRTPKSFVTDLGVGKDKKDDYSMIGGRNAISTESGKSSIPSVRTPFERSIIYLAQDDLTWRIGYREIAGKFCTPSYRTSHITSDQNGNVFSYQWLSKDFLESKERSNIAYKNEVFPMATGSYETIKLATHKVTNVFKIQPSSSVGGVRMDPFRAEQINGKYYIEFSTQGVRAAYYSLAFLLQRAMAARLDVDPEEIEVAEITRSSNGLGILSLGDQQQNGSGFVSHLYDNFPDYVDDILNGRSDFFKSIWNENHRHNCKEACYECLQVYRNMHFHGLLDWRLGMALLRLLTDSNYKVGSDGNFNSLELQDWMEYASVLRDTLTESFFGASKVDGLALPALKFTRGGIEKYVFIVHPLWSTDSSCKVLARACHQIGLMTNDPKVITIDTFNLSRRVSACIERILKK